MDFFKSDKVGRGRGSHYHIVFLSEEQGIGLMSTDNDHTHRIVMQPPQMDPMTGEPIGEPVWMVEPGGKDGHTHQIEPYERDYNLEKQEDSEIVADVKALWKASREAEGESLDKADEAEKFYQGDQWDEDTKSYLQKLNRAALTANLIGKEVDTIIGIQMDQRSDIIYAPVGDGDGVLSDLYNITSKKLLDNCNFPHEESAAFQDASIGGRGAVELMVKFDRDIRGEPVVRHLPANELMCGPHNRPDGEDMEYHIKHRMYSKAAVKQQWPKKADDIDIDWDWYGTTQGYNKNETKDDKYAFSDNQRMPAFYGQAKMVDLAKKEYRVLELWRKIYIKSHVIFNPQFEFYYNAEGWSEDDVKRAKTIQGFNYVSQDKAKYRITKVAGSVVLSDENPADLPFDSYYIFPIYCYKRGNKHWGKVEWAKDAQREYNQRMSQAIDIGNKTASYGWFIDASMFNSPKEKEKFKNVATSPGFVQEVQDAQHIPLQVDGVKFPSEIVGLMEGAQIRLQQLMNAKLSDGGANESGKHLMFRQKERMAGNEFLFDNLSQMKKQLGKVLIHVIRKYYPADRIFRLVSAEASQQQQDPMLGDQPMSSFSPEEIMDMIERDDAFQYDVSVTEAEQSPTLRYGTYLALQELAESGQPIPPDVILELNPFIPQMTKQKIMESLASANEQEAQSASGEQQTEIDKTLIAQGIVPPHIQQEYGLPPTLQDQGNVPQGEGSFPTAPEGGVVQGESGAKRKVVRKTQDPMTGDTMYLIDEMPVEGAA